MSDPTKKTLLEEALAGLAMLAVMGFGAWQATQSMRTPAVQAIKWSIGDFRQGVSTDAFSKALDKNLPWREPLIATANSGRYVLIRGAGDKLRLGRDGWLFSVEELQFEPKAAEHQAARLAILAQANQALQAQGVRLVVALVPDKARMLSRLLADGQYPAWQVSRYEDALASLRQQGLSALDLRPALSSASPDQAMYYRSDTHWNQAGAQSAAQALAASIRAMKLELPARSFSTAASGPVAERTGDLLRMMGVGDMPAWLRPPADSEAPQSTTQGESTVSGGLFDVQAVPVVLIGTSYSLRGNFHGFLQQALGAEVLNAAKDGAGFMASAKAYFADDAFKTAKPQLIVWELPERMLSAPLNEAEKQGLAW